MDAEARDRNAVVLLTPVGVGAIAVVRLLGPGVSEFLQQHFSVATSVGRATHGRLFDDTETIDDPLVARVAVDLADINLHGGTWVVQRVIDLAVSDGFERVEHRLPLPLQAIDADSTLEQEIIAWLPKAQTRAAIRLLLAQIEAWGKLLSDPIDRSAIRRAIDNRSLHWLLNPPTVAIIGPANVGKSTLANQLFGENRSITADVPGTTRDWVGELANLDGLAVMLIDTPGLRETRDAIEGEAIVRARNRIESADLIVIVTSANVNVDAIATRFPDAIRVNNKMDRARVEGINTNALSGKGVDELRRAIRGRFGLEGIDVTAACCWTERQRDLLRRLIV